MDRVVASKEVLAIIPARGGSKGIPRKNIKDFAGYPLIAYSIAAGLQAETVTRVIVSTDDEEIAEVARAWGAEVPFLRPDKYAQDNTLDLPVFQHALHWLKEHEGYVPDVVVQLRPTSPIRPKKCVDSAVRMLLVDDQVDSVRGVVPAGQNPHKMWRIDPETSRMKNLLEVEGIAEPYNAPRQSLPPVYWQTGHIDVIRPAVIMDRDSMSGSVIMPLLIDPNFTVDIDTPRDWQHYEWLLKSGGLEMVTPGPLKRNLPDRIELMVFDFDGVMTDNRVWVDQDGVETVAANRVDGMGIRLLREAGVKSMVLSTEVNPVVAARCKKLKMEYIHGVEDKASILRNHLEKNNINPNNVIYVGNDINDVSCFPIVGCAVVVADAENIAKEKADVILTRNGGYGAVRELCDMILQRH
jgi:N-acylneuraminate cytidylyltransferase